MVHALSPFVRVSRELSEIAYLWHAPHRIAGDKLKSLIGDVPHTPLQEAVRRSIQELARETRV
jgi:hypothetical protein